MIHNSNEQFNSTHTFIHAYFAKLLLFLKEAIDSNFPVRGSHLKKYKSEADKQVLDNEYITLRFLDGC